MKNAFDGHTLGAMLGEEHGELAINDLELIRKGGAVPGADRAAPYQLVTAPVAVDAAVTGAVGAGVDAEDPHRSTRLAMTLSLSKGHASEASISFSSISKFDQTCLTSSCSSSTSISFSIWLAGVPVSFT